MGGTLTAPAPSNELPLQENTGIELMVKHWSLKRDILEAYNRQKCLPANTKS